ncbi:hypothetical protein AVEN_20703-1 [Araneus ventricosus]|uniref:Uncharacterized protein n=1 Tax=Araneus ventricosus TaxID=182803 RepID=A0A4Y2HSX6_ARAVE|nr:hypothetical protein AVEN_20703-1 [Araneus ventricosus]
MHFCHRSYKDVNADYRPPFCGIPQSLRCCTSLELENRNPLRNLLIGGKRHMARDQGYQLFVNVAECYLLIGNLTSEVTCDPAPMVMEHPRIGLPCDWKL